MKFRTTILAIPLTVLMILTAHFTGYDMRRAVGFTLFMSIIWYSINFLRTDPVDGLKASNKFTKNIILEVAIIGGSCYLAIPKMVDTINKYIVANIVIFITLMLIDLILGYRKLYKERLTKSTEEDKIST